MNKNLKKIIQTNRDALKSSKKDLKSIYEIMFLAEDNILCESNDGFRVVKQTYGDINKRIEKAAAALYEKIGAAHSFVALELDNSAEWIVAFWAILKSGNKPYLVNMRYPETLSNGILKTLDVRYIICEKESLLNGESIPVSSLSANGTVPDDVFEDELAFSSSATSMNEVICYYSGYQIAEQILNFETIIKKSPRMAKHYKGSLKQLAFLPFYHIFGLFAVYFWFTFFGRTLVFLRDYSAETILKTCRRHEVTHIFAVPVLWHTIENQVLAAAKEQGEKKLAKLQKGLRVTTALQNICPTFGAWLAKRVMSEVTDKLFGKSVMFCISGGSYVRDSALYLINGIGYGLHNGYGMSEIGITSVELGRKPKQRNLNSIGMPFDSVEYKLDENGILLVRGSSLCTKKNINGKEMRFDGWFNTGDKMKYENGRYYILGREGDLVIGENGENINPDMIEKVFNLNGAKALSVLGLGEENEQELSIVIQVNPYITEAAVTSLINEVYALNDTLSKTQAIRRFYFTFDPLSPPSAIKVSRAQLKKKIANGEVVITPFNEMKVQEADSEESPLIKDVKKIIAEALGKGEDEILPTSHIFYDLGATSIQYFSILTKLSERFAISDYNKNDKYCYTPKEICEYIERHM